MFLIYTNPQTKQGKDTPLTFDSIITIRTIFFDTASFLEDD